MFLGNGTDGDGQISSSDNEDSVATGLSTCCHSLQVSCDSCSEFDQPFKQFYGSYVANHEKFNNHHPIKKLFLQCTRK